MKPCHVYKHAAKRVWEWDSEFQDDVGVQHAREASEENGIWWNWRNYLFGPSESTVTDEGQPTQKDLWLCSHARWIHMMWLMQVQPKFSLSLQFACIWSEVSASSCYKLVLLIVYWEYGRGNFNAIKCHHAVWTKALCTNTTELLFCSCGNEWHKDVEFRVCFSLLFITFIKIRGKFKNKEQWNVFAILKILNKYQLGY
jgi:hypothetical protein